MSQRKDLVPGTDMPQVSHEELSSAQGLNRAYRGPASDDVEIALQGQKAGLADKEVLGPANVTTRSQDNTLPAGTRENISKMAEFLSDKGGERESDLEIGAGKGAKARDLASNA